MIDSDCRSVNLAPHNGDADMSSLNERLYAQARIYPTRKENKIASVTKREDGSLSFVQNSGNEFDVSSEDKDIQAYAIFMMLGAGD